MQIERAFVELVTARSSALLRTAYLLTGNRTDAEDLVQEALLAVYRKRHHVRDVGALEGYVRTTLVRSHISRRRRRSSQEIPREQVPDTAWADGEPITSSELWPAITRLSPRQRAVVVLVYFEDLPEEEVARLLGCSAGAVKSHRSRALSALRRESHAAAMLAGGDRR